jgi:hypothetical protein
VAAELVRLALGLSVHTGWAACVAAGGSLEAPLIAARIEIQLLDDQERFVFHRAAEASAGAAAKLVARARADAAANAAAALGRLTYDLRQAGHELTRCAVVANLGAPPGSIAEIVAAHPRIHTAEGLFYRDVLCDAARATGMQVEVLSPKGLEQTAAGAMHVAAARLGELLARAGRAIGPPWSKDQKASALAAWIALTRT